MTEALRIAIVGAESTGKTTLAHALGATLASIAAPMPGTPATRAGRRVAVVTEVLREWCEEAGRTPLAGEQAMIARVQHERIEAAAADHEVVVCDTTALMTAVYGRCVFGDDSLDARAIELHRSMSITLLTALDLPWVADGHQRDGEHVRAPVDALLRELLIRHRLPFSVVHGCGPVRLEQAVRALAGIAPWLGGAVARTPEPARGGLFGALLGDAGAGADDPARRGWRCECCVPEAERASRRRSSALREP